MRTILLTGFKPFASHTINDSEACVKIIANSGLEKELNVNLITEIFDVSYTKTLEQIPYLWAVYNPFLVVHLGAHKEETIKIERCARKYGYRTADINGVCPAYELCTFGEHHQIYTEIDISRIVASGTRGDYVVGWSEDAELYLCEFVYYLSLSHDPKRTILIHVPPYDECDSQIEKALVIKDIIKDLYKERLIASCNLTRRIPFMPERKI